MNGIQNVELNKTILYYALEGNGIPCFVIGFGRYMRRLLSQALRQHFQFIFTDFRGLNPADTAFDITTLSLQNILDDIEALRQYLDFETIAICGHSTAGTVALDYTLAYPEYVSRTLLICSPPVYTREFRTFQQSYTQKYLSPERAHILQRNLKAFNRVKDTLDSTAYFLGFHKVQAPLYWYDPLYDGSDLWKGIGLNADVIMNFVPLVYDDHDASGAFHRIRVPVFLALGQYDFATPPSVWNSYVNTFQDITVKRYSRSSHYPMIDEREAFDRDVIQWLNALQ